MTETTPKAKFLTAIELLAKWGYDGEGQYDPATERLFVKSTDAALRTRGGFQWPWVGGTVTMLDATKHDDPRPRHEGDGVCVASTWEGARQGRHRLSTVLLVAVPILDILAEDHMKARVRSARVLAVVDWQAEARRKGAARASLHWADLRGAYLYGADLALADLTEADLRWADLLWADFRWANLRWADLYGANLRWADFRGADLSGADLSGTYLSGANLSGTYLALANLRWADLNGASWDTLTVWPDGFTPPTKESTA